MHIPPHILILEDDDEIALLEQDYLENAGYTSSVCSDGSLAVSEILSARYDLILLDLMLPGADGYEICRAVRSRTKLPILMVTALDDSTDKIRGLGLGANDYISKPFDPAELVARVRSQLAQYARLTEDGQAEPELVFQDLRILPHSWKVYKKGQELHLPNREFELLTFLASHPDQIFSREALFEHIWGYEYTGDTATVMVHIGRIREKIEDNPGFPTRIETVRGSGYRFNSIPKT